MMSNKDLYMGIDTSNYKTSMSLVNRDGEIVKDLRKFLVVASGQKGLRQSEAVFQHMTNIPVLAKELFEEYEGNRVFSITASVKPRPVEGSYMPCFKAGESFATALGSALNVPVNQVSHQEGHIAAIQETSQFKEKNDFLVFHLSGGTTEVLRVKDSITLLGGSRDISYGQLIDRAGVKIGLPFPCGEALDDMAATKAVKGAEDNSRVNKTESSQLKPISIQDGWINLSGIDTQLTRALDHIFSQDFKEIEAVQRILLKAKQDLLIKELFGRINQSLIKLINFWSTNTGCNDILMTGGVASSKTIRNCLNETFNQTSNSLNNVFSKTSVTLEFGKEELASDNAVGLAFIGRKISCQKTQ